MAISDNTIVIHDSNPRFVGLLLIALIVVSIGYFVITTIHDMNREKRLDAIKKDIERNNSVIGILLILAMTGLAPTYSSQGRYEEYTPWFPIVLTMCFVGIGITCIISSVSNRRKKYEEYDDEVISREKREKKSKITALYDMIPIWLQEVLRIGIPLIGIIVIMNFVVLGTSVMSGSMEPKLKVGSSDILFSFANMKDEDGVTPFSGVKFYARYNEAKIGRNPATGESVNIAAKYQPKVRFGSHVKEIINN